MRHALAFVSVVVLFGMNYPATRICNRYIPPIYGAGLRFALAAVILLAIVALRRIPLPRGKALRAAILYGAIAYAGAFGCLFFALSLMGAAPVAVLFATAPLFTALFAAAYGVEKLSLRKIVGTGAALVGSAWIYRKGLQIDVKPVAFLLTLCAACCAGLSAVILKRAPRSHPLGTNAVASAFGGALLLGIAVAGGFTHARWERPAVLALAWVIVLGTVVGFSLVTWLILHWDPTKVNYQGVLSPPVAALSAALVLHEPIQRDLIVGAVAVLAGAWAVLGERRQPAAAPAQSGASR